MKLWPRFSLVIPPGSAASGTLMGCLLCDCLCFEGSDLTETARMPLGLTEFGSQDSLDEIRGYGRSHGPAAHTNNVYVVVPPRRRSRRRVLPSRRLLPEPSRMTNSG